jgi:small subunit ribosomal protein S20
VPNTRSAAKMMRVAERRRLRNRSVKSAVKTFIRKAEQGVSAVAEDAQALVVQAQRSLDKAAAKGILHPRNAARRKSRLMKKLSLALTAPAVQPVETAPVRKSRSRTAGAGASRKKT